MMGIWNDLLQPQNFWMIKKAPSKNCMQAITALHHVNSKMSAAEKHAIVVPSYRCGSLSDGVRCQFNQFKPHKFFTTVLV